MDVYDKTTRSRVMRSVKSKDTGAEMIVRRLLHKAGFRYRLHRKDLPGNPDLVFPGRRKVIFVHGCFWHQHLNCRYADRPSSNTDYWQKKLDRNMARDKETLQMLEEAGWQSYVVWECQAKKQDELLSILTKFLTADHESDLLNP